MPLVMRLCDPVIVLDRGPRSPRARRREVQTRPARPRRVPRQLTVRVVLEDVVAGYGFGDVLRGLDLVAEAGEITCLIGPNGAGKSTVLRAVSGLLQTAARHRSRLGEHEITGLSPRGLLALGVVHVPQERSLFPLMTVWENLLMGGYILRDRRAVTPARRGARRAVPAARASGVASGRARSRAASRRRSRSPAR